MTEAKAVQLKNKEAAPLYWIIGGALMIPMIAGLFSPQRFEVLGLLLVIVLLLGRYLLPTKCEIKDQSIVFIWPLRKVELTPESLAKAALLPGAVNTLGLRAKNSVRFGIRPSVWSNPKILIEALETLIEQAPAGTVMERAAIVEAIPRL